MRITPIVAVVSSISAISTVTRTLVVSATVGYNLALLQPIGWGFLNFSAGDIEQITNLHQLLRFHEVESEDHHRVRATVISKNAAVTNRVGIVTIISATEEGTEVGMRVNINDDAAGLTVTGHWEIGPVVGNCSASYGLSRNMQEVATFCVPHDPYHCFKFLVAEFGNDSLEELLDFPQQHIGNLPLRQEIQFFRDCAELKTGDFFDLKLAVALVAFCVLTKCTADVLVAVFRKDIDDLVPFVDCGLQVVGCLSLDGGRDNAREFFK